MRGHDNVSINAQSASGAGTQGSGAQTIAFVDLYDLNLDGVFESPFPQPAASAVAPNRIIDPDYHQPFVDEFAFGYRRQLPGQLAVDIGYMHRSYRDRTALVEQNGIYDGSVFRGYRNEALNDIFLLTSNEWNWPVYQAIEAIVTKRTSRFQILGSYTRAFDHIAGTWQPNDPASFIQPGTFANNRGLDPNDNRSASVNNAYSAGTSGFEWLNHIARASVVYQAPWKFQVATNYSIQRGRWSGPILNRIAAADPQFGTPTVTLSNGRVVSNPLATTLRFANEDRGAGQLQLDALHILNLRVGRRFEFGAGRVLMVDLDVLNLPNRGGFQGWLAGANQTYNANYGRGGEVQPPRTYQLGLRFLF
jgi:hypothetical protein